MEAIDIKAREGEIHHGDYEKMEHHEESFIQKYIFSQDHKTISKQYLITGIFWALLGGLMSLVFRLQLGFPGINLEWLKPILAMPV